MSITVKDLARICGVSRATVDRALHNKAQISEETRQKVLKAAEQYGYRPHLLARGLSKGSTQRLGVVASDITAPYFVQMLIAIEQQAQARGYSINIALHDKDLHVEQAQLRDLASFRMDGILLIPTGQGAAFEAFLQSLSVPVVTIGDWVSNQIPLVGIQEREASAKVTAGLVQKGYERIVFVCPPFAKELTHTNIYGHQERYRGLTGELQKHPQVELITYSHSDYPAIIQEVTALPKKRTVFFCSGDKPALQTLLALQRAGYSVPSDFGVHGFGGTELVEYSNPCIETVDSNIAEIGRTAVELLIRQVNGEEIPPATYIDYKILPGGSL